jgi:phage anti-repressor protein
MDQLITNKPINFNDVVKNSNTTISLDIQSKLVELMNIEFTEEEQRWYVANLYVYMNYHPTNDYPINLEDVYKMIGFVHKKNAKRTLENNFTKNEDYKITILPSEKGQIAREEDFLLLPTEKQKTDENRGGHNKETVMLNVDTFKNLCMMVKTDKGKEIRKYYVKLENIYNKIIKQEIEQQKQELDEQKQLLLEKDNIIINKDLEKKREVEMTLKISFNKRCLVYLIKIILNDEIIYKFGYTDDIVTRLRTHKNQISEDIELVYCI